MAERIACAGLQVDAGLHRLVETDILPGTDISSTSVLVRPRQYP